MSDRRNDPELASVLRKVLNDRHVFVAMSTHQADDGCYEFTIDDTTVSITEEEGHAVREVMDWG